MENITFIREILLPPVLEGTLVTLKLIASSIPLGLILGILIAVGRVYGNKFISSFLCCLHIIFSWHTFINTTFYSLFWISLYRYFLFSFCCSCNRIYPLQRSISFRVYKRSNPINKNRSDDGR